ncbi:hypothetical protein OUZ56_023030 [Daphnia magna]|uniref:Uncharacterized protein n=1 Tax=Daphnia magna TaxID=35525 RepID=A0ABR0AY52_9CRUS|nr:hypothetical protein OUZ56_023030 [Daphnia magna]
MSVSLGSASVLLNWTLTEGHPILFFKKYQMSHLPSTLPHAARAESKPSNPLIRRRNSKEKDNRLSRETTAQAFVVASHFYDHILTLIDQSILKRMDDQRCSLVVVDLKKFTVERRRKLPPRPCPCSFLVRRPRRKLVPH